MRKTSLPAKIDNLLWVAVFTTIALTAVASSSAKEECSLRGDCVDEEISCAFDKLFRATLPLNLELNPQGDSSASVVVAILEHANPESPATRFTRSLTAHDVLSNAPKTSPPFAAISTA